MDRILVQLNRKLLAAQKHNQNDEYLSLKTDEDRVKFTIRLLRDNNMCPEIKNNPKSSSNSTKYRNIANKLYTLPTSPAELQLDSIIQYYTMSVAYAPPGSQELPLAYANRSAALFSGGLYADCLLDIERALALSYPDKLRAKLFLRKARSLMILNGNSTESEQAQREARAWLDKMDSNGKKNIETILNNPQQMVSIREPRKLLNDEINLPAIPQDNPEIPGASSALAIKYSNEFGRHVVATRDIEPGEILVLQQHYASILHPEKSYTHCANCLRQTWSAIPCEYCVEVMYCTESCREAAWINHHDIECGVTGSLLALDMSALGLMSMRLAIRAIKEAGDISKLKKSLQVLDNHVGMLI